MTNEDIEKLVYGDKIFWVRSCTQSIKYNIFEGLYLSSPTSQHVRIHNKSEGTDARVVNKRVFRDYKQALSYNIGQIKREITRLLNLMEDVYEEGQGV